MKKKKLSWGRLLTLVAIIGFVVACATVPLTGRKQFAFMNNGELSKMSLQQYNQTLSGSKLSVNERDVAMIKRVGGKISKAVEQYLRQNGLEHMIADYQWEFNLIEDEVANAWCMPGGKVAFYTGILPITQTETGVAVVMGHEVAHAIANHSNERMSQGLLAQGVSIGAMLAIGASEMDGNLSNLLAQAVGMGTQLGTLAFSRKHESEADHMGLMFMAMAGYDPSESVGFWGRMAAQSGGQKPPELLSTHPADETRIANLRRLLPEAMAIYEQNKVN